MQISRFGQQLTAHSGILQLMDDLGNALAGGGDHIKMLGGGNPAHIGPLQEVYRKRMHEILDNDDEFEKMVGNYLSPQGDQEFIQAMAELLNDQYDWGVTDKNIAITNSSQTAFFILFNLLAGKFEDGSTKHILFPIVPEYIGYADQGLSDGIFEATEPIIDILDDHTFKYRIDFDKLDVTDDTTAICISRPTNPTGNVITDEEVNKLHKIAKEKDIQLIIDNAYGAPFPNMIFTQTNPIWDDNIIHSISLSKLGLPGLRTSIIVANEEIIDLISKINAIVALASGTVGQRLTLPLIKSQEIIEISKKEITTFYKDKSDKAIKFFNRFMDVDVPFYIHKSEGSLFLWLWCKDMPISSMELYESLKEKHTIVVPGEYFFPGHNQEWKHKQECIRVSYAQEDDVVERGIKDICDIVNEAYKLSP